MVNPPGLTVRRLAGARLQEVTTSRREELLLAAVSLESLTFLIWRHLEHFLLYSSAALAAPPVTPYQVTLSPGLVGQGCLIFEGNVCNLGYCSLIVVNPTF
jgi:hypothetical protein